MPLIDEMNEPWNFPVDCCDFSNTFTNMLREAYRFLTEEFDVDFKAVVSLILAGISLVLSTGFQLYTKIRPKFPIKVNCWFCNTDSKTHFHNRNSWTCTKCDQYNGFTQSGDYNRTLPELSCENLNHSVQSVKWEPYKPSHNGLCRKCNINQELKVQQLASFVPISKANFDEEIEVYRQRLDRAYRLCNDCEGKLHSKLSKISKWINQIYPVKFPTHQEPKQKNFAFWLSSALRILSLAGSTLSFLSALLEINKVQSLVLIPFQGKFISKWSLPLDITNIALIMLAATFSSPQLSSSDLMSSMFWFLTATAKLVSINPIAKNFKKIACVFHILFAVVSSIVTAVVHTRTLKRELPRLKNVPSPSMEKRDTEIEKPVQPSNRSSPILNASSGSRSDTPELKLNVTPAIEKLSLPESPMKPVQSSLNSLTLGPSFSPPRSTSSVFEPRVYSSSAMLFTNLDGKEVRRRKPIVHPPKFNPWTNSYWGSVPVPLSRSSSQSSGFASQNGTNFSSLPNSRSGSVCGDVDRFSVLSEPIYPSFKSYNQPFYVPCVPQFYLPPVPGVQTTTPYQPPPLSPNSSQSSVDTTAQNESAFSANSVILPDKSFFSLMRENFGLATVFLCSIVFNAVVIALAVANTLSASPVQ